MVKAYKVVNKRNRRGTNWTLFTCNYHYWGSPEYKKFEKFVKENPDYFPIYKKGAVIKSPHGSCGIMCFETYKSAAAFKSINSIYHEMIIVKIKGKRILKHKKMVHGCGGLEIFNIKIKKKRLNIMPYGTICFKEIEVLE